MRKLFILSLLTLSLQVIAKSAPDSSDFGGIDVDGNVTGSISNEIEHKDNDSSVSISIKSNNNIAILTNSKLNTWFWNQNNQNLQIKKVATILQKDTNTYGDIRLGEYKYYNTEEQVNAVYFNGRFSAQTGYLTENNEASKFFVQSSYIVFTNYKFNVAVTAKIETLDTELVQYYYGKIRPNQHISDTNTNATLGLIGTYELNSNWTIIGALTSTALADGIADSPLVEQNKYNMALIGTTYSF